MPNYRLYGSREGYTSVEGILCGRFIIPERLTVDNVCMFPVVDTKELQSRLYATQTDWEARANFFGVSWANNDDILTQLFGYRTASTREMEAIASSAGKDEGGYFYICFKSPLHSDKTRILPESLERESETGVELLGWEHHGSRYYPHANEEAMMVTYGLAEEFGRKQAEMLGKDFEIVIQDENLAWTINNKPRMSDYKNKRLRTFSPEQLIAMNLKAGKR